MIQKKKKQHFVPKFYLRNFSSDGKNVNIYHIKCKTLHKSPINTTCQESFFYGRDQEFENFLEILDNIHAKIFKEIFKRKTPPLSTDEWIGFLQFILVQHNRTRLERNVIESYGDEICDHYLKPPMQSILKARGKSDQEIEGYTVKITNMDIFHKQSIIHSMESIIGIRDLVPCVFANNTKTPFIISDNPIVFNNRIHLDDNFTALLSRGLQIHCPLNPHLYVVLFDPAYYSIDESQPPTFKDINRLNALQLLNCNEILVASDGTLKEYLDQLCSQYMNLKQKKRAIIQTIRSEWLNETRRSDIDLTTTENANYHINFEFLKFNHAAFRIFKNQYLSIKKENPIAAFPRDFETLNELKKYQKKLEEEYSRFEKSSEG